MSNPVKRGTRRGEAPTTLPSHLTAPSAGHMLSRDLPGRKQMAQPRNVSDSVRWAGARNRLVGIVGCYTSGARSGGVVRDAGAGGCNVVTNGRRHLVTSAGGQGCEADAFPLTFPDIFRPLCRGEIWENGQPPRVSSTRRVSAFVRFDTSPHLASPRFPNPSKQKGSPSILNPPDSPRRIQNNRSARTPAGFGVTCSDW